MKIINTFLFTVALILITNCGKSQTKQLTPKQIERVSKTCQLWGHIKYFHPYLFDKSIDWESAFTENIDKIITSKNNDEYAKAIQDMLDKLNDPATYVIIKSELKTKKDSVKYPIVKFIKDSILLVSVKDYTDLEDFYYCHEQFSSIKEKIPLSKGIIFDLRGNKPLDEFKGWLPYFFEDINSYLNGHEISLLGLKARMHDGFAPESGGTSGG